MISETPKPRVLQIGKFYPPHRGGIETHLRDLCVALRDRFEFHVVVAADGRRSSRQSIDGIRVTRVATPLTVASAPICPGLINVLRQSDADLVHLHWPHPTGALALLGSGNRAPLVVTYHSDVVRQRLLGRAFRPILHRILSRAAVLIATSDRYIESSEVLGLHRPRCQVVSHGIDGAPHDQVDPATIEAIRSKFGPRLVLAVGRLTSYKGFEYLIRAMTDVHATLLIVGTGPERARLEGEVARCGAPERVRLLGEVDDVVPYYHAADVFVLPSVARSEAFGIVQLEAMAAGKPVVNTALDSGVPFVSIDGVTGITVRASDSTALGTALNRLLDDDALRNRLGRAARRRFHDEFTLSRMAERTSALYARVLDQSRPAGRALPVVDALPA